MGAKAVNMKDLKNSMLLMHEQLQQVVGQPTKRRKL